jgi:hypothetical protein
MLQIRERIERSEDLTEETEPASAGIRIIRKN